MSKKVELKISVFKDCGTCKHIKFLNDWATAKCLLSNKIVIEKKKSHVKNGNLITSF